MDQSLKPGALFWLGCVAAVGMVVGGFGPWVTVLGAISVAGTEGDGWILIGLGVALGVGLAVTFSRRHMTQGAGIVVVLAGLAAAGTAAYDLTNINGVGDGTFLEDAANPGWGIYLSLAAGLLAIAVGFAVATGKMMFELVASTAAPSSQPPPPVSASIAPPPPPPSVPPRQVSE